MDLTDKEKELFIDFGALEYSPEKISSIIDCNKEELERQINDPTSDVYKLLKKGKYMSDYVIDKKLFELAKSGDTKAVTLLEKRKRRR